VYFNLFAAHHAPSTFGFDTAHGRQAFRSGIAKAIAVGYLVKTIFGRHRADLYRLKEYPVCRRAAWGVGHFDIQIIIPGTVYLIPAN